MCSSPRSPLYPPKAIFLSAPTPQVPNNVVLCCLPSAPGVVLLLFQKWGSSYSQVNVKLGLRVSEQQILAPETFMENPPQLLLDAFSMVVRLDAHGQDTPTGSLREPAFPISYIASTH